MNPDSPTPNARLLRILGVFLSVALFSAAVVFLLPLVFAPRIDTPTGLKYATPSSVDFRISNQNFTALTDVEYACEISKLILANGSAVENAQEVIRGRVRNIPARHAIAARCETSAIITSPVKAAEYKLKITYKPYPWPQQRSVEYRIEAEVNGRGEVTAWKPD